MYMIFKVLLLSVAMVSTYVFAQDELTISSLASDKSTQETFNTMVNKQKLPDWVTLGGTDTPAVKVNIGGREYLVLRSCKPHDCGAESIAIIFSPESKVMAGVLSTMDADAVNQKLLWLNIPDQLSIDGKTILFAALTGSLDNHPGKYNL